MYAFVLGREHGRVRSRQKFDFRWTTGTVRQRVVVGARKYEMSLGRITSDRIFVAGPNDPTGRRLSNIVSTPQVIVQSVGGSDVIIRAC